jgi:hypothetical protein
MQPIDAAWQQLRSASMLAVFNAGLDSFTSTSRQLAFYARFSLKIYDLTHCCGQVGLNSSCQVAHCQLE